MEVKELLTQIQQQYNAWKLERDQEEIVTDISDVQLFLAAYMYDYVIEFVKDVKKPSIIYGRHLQVRKTIFVRSIVKQV